MDVLEQKLEDYILSRYKSIREFDLNIEMPYSTIDTILKHRINKASVENVLKICQSLEISADALADGEIIEAAQECDLINDLPQELQTLRALWATTLTIIYLPGQPGGCAAIRSESCGRSGAYDYI